MLGTQLYPTGLRSQPNVPVYTGMQEGFKSPQTFSREVDAFGLMVLPLLNILAFPVPPSQKTPALCLARG